MGCGVGGGAVGGSITFIIPGDRWRIVTLKIPGPPCEGVLKFQNRTGDRGEFEHVDAVAKAAEIPMRVSVPKDCAAR